MTVVQNPAKQHPPRFAESSHTIAEFLAWAEEKKGLLLCRAYKPKYAWYTPTGSSAGELLTEFLAAGLTARVPASPVPEQISDGRAPVTAGHGRPSRLAMRASGK